MRKKKKSTPVRRSPAIRPPVAKKKKKTREPPVVDELANEEDSENELLQTCLGNPVGWDNERCRHCGQWMEEMSGVYVCLSC